ncbi:hypothetical protein DPM19_23210 [Actinomadura craniellae]|uniref:XRE family transcriptional regulator n=1 Tax=Actinomadura craniellae TaxID=2231787 RepID=A0A365H1G3_9ACTN|nr:hypothetical protein [Actinomadura craniellae]RAY12921.1 hypothetical protein DPM19_23210 [Actinomadura craniellae]
MERFLELNYPGQGTEREKLKLIILYVLLHGPDRDQVIAHARRWDINPHKAEQFMRGDVEFGFRWYSIEGTLTDCGAGPAVIEVAKKLFDDFSRSEPAQQTLPTREPDQPRADGDPGHYPGRPDEDPSGETATEPRPGRGLKPDPLTATTATELMTLMSAYRVWKGKASYRKMANAVGNRYAASTFSTLSNRPTLPSLDLVRAYIEGCGADQADLEIWTRAWQQIALTEPDQAH